MTRGLAPGGRAGESNNLATDGLLESKEASIATGAGNVLTASDGA